MRYNRDVLRLALAFLLAWLPSVARADSRPTSDDASLRSGRTLGNGELLVAVTAGWPGVEGEVLFSPSSRFDVGPRLSLLYASPFLGFATGLGGELSLPMRLHLYGKRDVDVALAARPLFVIGDGALVGQEGIFADDRGFGVGAEVGARVGLHLGDAFTLGLGASATLAYVSTPDADAAGGGGGSDGIVGVVTAQVLAEALLSRSTLLLADLRAGGGGHTGDGLFSSRAHLQLALGVAYRP
ncbi:MAG: hypothetical protein AAGH15_25555 [Myxococcota bacterium]